MSYPSLVTAMITPFYEEKVDLEGLEENIKFQLQAGIEGLLFLGTTGESPSLTKVEKRSLLELARKTVPADRSFWVGTGTFNTETTIERTFEAEQLGADVALIVTPYYNCPTQEGILKHFEAVVENTTIPICLYNHPKRCGVNIEIETLKKIAKLPNIIGIKEVSGDLTQISRIQSEIVDSSENFSIWAGDDLAILPLMSLGVHGLISVASNLLPKEMFSLLSLLTQNDFLKSKSLYYRIFPLLKALTIETNPLPIKAAMNYLNRPSGSCRSPLSSLKEDNLESLKKIINSANFVENGVICG
ncbi:MAG: 4-hydroxy-tetrahydrodipicolinate synthase [Chlamydiae bacterium]|nr:4-hydroxy-tetrahydrodipicolinate synthase [Chlamydiota bacterium]